MPDLFSTFGRQGSANPYMWPDMGGSFGFGKQGLMGAPSGLPTQAQGQGVPGGPTGVGGLAPGGPTSLAPPPLDFSKIGGASGAPDMSALGTPPAAAPPVGAPIAPPGAMPPAGLPIGVEGTVSGAPGAPADPLTIAGQVQGPMPGVPGGTLGAMGSVSPANYQSMVNQAMLFGKRAF